MAATAPSRKAILAQLDDVYVQQRRLREEELRLKGLLNATLPVNQIPADILALIFTLCPSPVTDRGARSRSDDSYQVSNFSWLHLTLVCRYWRDLTHGMPALWRGVDVRSTPPWLTLCLDRSAQCTLDLAFHSPKFSPENFKDLLPHRHRIRSLWFNEVDETWLETLCSLLRHDMKALETLHYPRKWSKRDSKCSAELSLTHQHHPLLQSVTLAGMKVSCDPPMYTKLVSIDFESCKCNISFPHFAELLKASKNLRTLRLYEVLNHLGTPTPRKPSQDVVELPHLRDVILEGDSPRSYAALLSYFQFPNVEYLAVNGEKATLGSLDQLAQLLPSDATPCLPMVQNVTRILLTAYDYTYELMGYDNEPYYWNARPIVKLSISASRACNLTEALPQALVDLVNLFQGAPLTYLSISSVHDPPAILPTHWAAVFRAFPQLEVLILPVGHGMTKKMWEGLQHASPVTSADTGGAVACRALRRVCFDVDAHFSVDEELLETILECLRVRAGRGTRLEELFLYMFPRCFDEHEQMRAKFLPQLKALVTRRVEYRCSNACQF